MDAPRAVRRVAYSTVLVIGCRLRDGAQPPAIRKTAGAYGRATARRQRRIRIDRRSAARSIPPTGAESQERSAIAPARRDVARQSVGLSHTRLSSRQDDKRETTISWVWDVFDQNDHRALRITGEEIAKGAHRDAWSVADDEMLNRIARNSMDQLATFLTSAEVAPGTPMAAAPRADRHDRRSRPDAGSRRYFPYLEAARRSAAPETDGAIPKAPAAAKTAAVQAAASH